MAGSQGLSLQPLGGRPVESGYLCNRSAGGL
jgi:hypothetical protein